MNNMITNVSTLAELKELSIHIPTDGLIFVNSRWDTEHCIFPLAANSQTYSLSNNVIYFVDKEYNVYIIPYSKCFINILRAEGFYEEYINLPISHGEYPKFQKEKWNNILLIINKINWDNFRSDAKKLARSRNVQSLPTDLIKNAIEIPINGIKVKKEHGIRTMFPLIISPKLDDISSSFIGTYNSNGNMVVIQSDEGKTYSMSHSEGIDIVLSNLGYVKKEQPIPLLHKELIIY